MGKDYGRGPHVAVDGVVMYLDSESLKILVVRRKNGQVALPGGFVDPEDESLVSACVREIREETGLDLKEYLAIFAPLKPETDKNRDPRSWVISFPFLFILPDQEPPKLICGDEVDEVFWISEDRLEDQDWFLDHLEILNRI